MTVSGTENEQAVTVCKDIHEGGQVKSPEDGDSSIDFKETRHSNDNKEK